MIDTATARYIIASHKRATAPHTLSVTDTLRLKFVEDELAEELRAIRADDWASGKAGWHSTRARRFALGLRP